jgi:hypothetical protein
LAASTTSETDEPVPAVPVGSGADAEVDGWDEEVDPGSVGEVEPGVDGDAESGADAEADAPVDGSVSTDAALALAYSAPPRRVVAAAKATTTFLWRPSDRR